MSITSALGSQGFGGNSRSADSFEESIESLISQIPSKKNYEVNEHFLRILQKLHDQEAYPFSLYVTTLINALDLFPGKEIPETIRDEAIFRIVYLFCLRFHYEKYLNFKVVLDPTLGGSEDHFLKVINIFKNNLTRLEPAHPPFIFNAVLQNLLTLFPETKIPPSIHIKSLNLIVETYLQLNLKEYQVGAIALRPTFKGTDINPIVKSLDESPDRLQKTLLFIILSSFDSPSASKLFIEFLEGCLTEKNLSIDLFLDQLRISQQLFSGRKIPDKILNHTLFIISLIQRKFDRAIFSEVFALLRDLGRDSQTLFISLVEGFKGKEISESFLISTMSALLEVFPGKLIPSKIMAPYLRAIASIATQGQFNTKILYKELIREALTDLDSVFVLFSLADVHSGESEATLACTKEWTHLFLNEHLEEQKSINLFFASLKKVSESDIFLNKNYIILLKTLACLFKGGVLPSHEVRRALSVLSLIQHDQDFDDYEGVASFLMPTYLHLGELRFLNEVVNHLNFIHRDVSLSAFNKLLKISIYFLMSLSGKTYEEVDAKLKGGLIQTLGFESPAIALFERWLYEDSSEKISVFNQWLYVFTCTSDRMGEEIARKYSPKLIERLEKINLWKSLLKPSLPIGCSTRRVLLILEMVRKSLSNFSNSTQVMVYFLSLVPEKTFSHEEEEKIAKLFRDCFGNIRFQAEPYYLLLLTRLSPYSTLRPMLKRDNTPKVDREGHERYKTIHHDKSFKELKNWPITTLWDEEAISLIDYLYSKGKIPFKELYSLIDILVGFFDRVHKRASKSKKSFNLSYKSGDPLKVLLYQNLASKITDNSSAPEKVECLTQACLAGGKLSDRNHAFIKSMPLLQQASGSGEKVKVERIRISLAKQLALIDVVEDKETLKEWFINYISFLKLLSDKEKADLMIDLQGLNRLIDVLEKVGIIMESHIEQLAMLPVTEKSLILEKRTPSSLNHLIDSTIIRLASLHTDQFKIIELASLTWLKSLSLLVEELLYLYQLSCQKVRKLIPKDVLFGKILAHPSLLPLLETKGDLLKSVEHLYNRLSGENQKKAIQLLKEFPEIERDSPDEPLPYIHGTRLVIDKRG